MIAARCQRAGRTLRTAAMDCLRSGSIGAAVNPRMALRAKRDEVLLRIIAALAAEFFVVDLEV
jgi:hypothetical protein